MIEEFVQLRSIVGIVCLLVMYYYFLHLLLNDKKHKEIYNFGSISDYDYDILSSKIVKNKASLETHL